MSDGSIVKLSEFLRSPPGRYVLDWEQRHLDAAVVDISAITPCNSACPKSTRCARTGCRCASARPTGDYAVEAGEGERRQPGRGHQPATKNCRSRRTRSTSSSCRTFSSSRRNRIRSCAKSSACSCRRATSSSPDSTRPACGACASTWLASAHRRICRARAASSRLPRIKDWLKLLSFDVERGRFGCYVPSVRSDRWLRALALHGEGRRPLVAVPWRGLPADRGQARARHAPGRRGLEAQGKEPCAPPRAGGDDAGALTTGDGHSAAIVDAPGARPTSAHARRGASMKHAKRSTLIAEPERRPTATSAYRDLDRRRLQGQSRTRRLGRAAEVRRSREGTLRRRAAHHQQPHGAARR